MMVRASKRPSELIAMFALEAKPDFLGNGEQLARPHLHHHLPPRPEPRRGALHSPAGGRTVEAMRPASHGRFALVPGGAGVTTLHLLGDGLFAGAARRAHRNPRCSAPPV